MTDTTKQPPPSASDFRVLPLPSGWRDGDADLHAVAARLLQLAQVRSVSIDADRSEAVIRLHANRPIDSSLDELADAAADLTAVTQWPTTSDLTGVTDTSARPSTPLPGLVSWTDPASGHLYFIKLPAQVHGWRKMLLLVAAGFWLLVGLLGVVLPGLPTTPFVLLASYCLLRTSPTLHQRLLHTRLFGGVLRDWHLHRGIRPHIRTKAVALVVLAVAASLLLTNLPLAAKLTIAALAAVGIYYVWRLPSVVE